MIKIAFSNIVKKISLTLTTIFSLTITLFIISFMYASFVNLDHLSKRIDQGFKVVVDINPKLSRQNDLNSYTKIESKILDTKHVKSFKFSSKSVELQSILDSDSTKELSKSIKSDNPLSDTYYVTVDSEKNLKMVANEISKIKNVDSASYGGTQVESIIKKLHSWENFMFIAIGILLVISILLMMNILRVAIINQKDAIEIMRLVGASNNYIRMPYVIEAWVVSFISVILSSILTYFSLNGLYSVFSNIVSDSFTLININFMLVTTCAISFGTAFLISVLSSIITIRRFIKI